MEEIMIHYGVKGMKWGVRHDRKNPSISYHHTKKDARSINNIYKTLSDKEKRFVQGLDHNDPNIPKHFTNTKEMNSEFHVKTIIAKCGKTPISAVSIWKQNDSEVAISILTRNSPKYRNKGYGIKALREANNVLCKTDFTKVTWGVDKDNIASQKLAEKMGFKFESHLDGTWLVYTKDINTKRHI